MFDDDIRRKKRIIKFNVPLFSSLKMRRHREYEEKNPCVFKVFVLTTKCDVKVEINESK
jgi:hypothetical protein